MIKELKQLPKFKDIRNTIRTHPTKDFPNVGTKVKDTHVIHHSLTETGSPGSFANYHIDTHGWPGIAYAFVIQKDGTIYFCNDLFLRTYHAGNTNTRSIGTCLVGDFRKGKQKPTQAQMESLYLLNKKLYEVLPNMKRTIGHQECPGYSWKNCPGDNWDYRKVINGDLVTSDNKDTPDVLPKVYKIQEGDTFWSIANKHDEISVDKLIEMNPNVNYKSLEKGQFINLAPNEYSEMNAEEIMGKSKVGADQITEFIKTVNKNFNPDIAKAFIKVGEQYGVRGDVAICQSIHETNWFRYGGDVKADQNNFAGIGATGGVPGNSFDTIEDGVTAQIQHLYGYATKDPLPKGEEVLDPRFKILEDNNLRGTATEWVELGGKWAWPGYPKSKYDNLAEAFAAGDTYGHAILRKYNKLLKVEVPEVKEREDGGFPDVPEGTEYDKATKWLKEQGIMVGYGNGEFGLKDNMTRGDFAVVMYRALKK